MDEILCGMCESETSIGKQSTTSQRCSLDTWHSLTYAGGNGDSSSRCFLWKISAKCAAVRGEGGPLAGQETSIIINTS